MKLKFSRKSVLKFILILFGLIFIGTVVVFWWVTQPKSDEDLRKLFAEKEVEFFVEHRKFEGHDVRILKFQDKIDTQKQTLIFVHGSPGSALDFKRYYLDPDLRSNYNLVAYDRIGYGQDRTEVLSSVRKEVELLKMLVNSFSNDGIILIGYSYGGTIVAAFDQIVTTKVLLAPAIRSDLEPIFWMLKFYQWKATRPLVPRILGYAAQEKFQHLTELPGYETKWNLNSTPIWAIHGDADKIVPYENSVYLKSIFDGDQFTLITLEGVGHALIWTDFDKIKMELLYLKKLNSD